MSSPAVASERQELITGPRVRAHVPAQRAGHRARAASAHAAQAHAQVLRLDHDTHAAGAEVTVQPVRYLLGEPLVSDYLAEGLAAFGLSWAGERITRIG